MPPIEYKPLNRIISMDGVSFSDWIGSERQILTPRLKELGYDQIHFYMGDSDPEGPVTRLCTAVGLGEKTERFYWNKEMG